VLQRDFGKVQGGRREVRWRYKEIQEGYNKIIRRYRRIPGR
jgi:hypothetical protein